MSRAREDIMSKNKHQLMSMRLMIHQIFASADVNVADDSPNLRIRQ